MTRDEALSRVRMRLDRRTDLEADILAEMDLFQNNFFSKNFFFPWFLLSEFNYYDTEAGEERIPVPSDFFMEYEEGALWYYDSTADEPWLPLVKGFDDRQRAALGDEIDATGAPKYYSLDGSYYRLKPVPDDVYRLYHRYYFLDSAPSSLADGGQTNLWLTHAPDCLIMAAALAVGTGIQMQKEKLDRMETNLANAMRRIYTETEARRHTNRRYIMGGADA